MNPYSGDIEQFPTDLFPLRRLEDRALPPQKQRVVPEGWLSLTEEEAVEFETLPKMMRIERYIKYHRTDKCANCGCFVGNHHPKKFIECAATELARIDCLRLEKEEVHA